MKRVNQYGHRPKRDTGTGHRRIKAGKPRRNLKVKPGQPAMGHSRVVWSAGGYWK